MKKSFVNTPLLSRIKDPLISFVKLESFGGIVLICTSILALVLANLPDGKEFLDFWEEYAGFQFGDFKLKLSVLHWINDGLMAVFFFVVGLEIKREILTGGLSSIKKASLPIFGAVGGMLVPALIFFGLNQNGPGAHAWGIPMATDIAFALGILTLLGKRIPLSLKLLLTSIAIIDDIGAVIVIAVFYTSKIHMTALLYGALVLAVLFLLNFLNIRNRSPYLILGVVLWFALLQSGLHATLAGVLLAFSIPARANTTLGEFLSCNMKILNNIKTHKEETSNSYEQKYVQSAIHTIEENCDKAISPLQYLEHKLHPYVVYFIVPLFALANAGLALDSDLLFELSNPISIGIFLGLFIGKPLGIVLFSKLGSISKLASKPSDVKWSQILGLGFLGGIGFTMSFFVAQLAFPAGMELNIAKLAVLLSSLISGIVGFLILRYTSKPIQEKV